MFNIFQLFKKMKRLVCHELAAEFKDKFHSQYQMHLYIFFLYKRLPDSGNLGIEEKCNARA